MATSTSCCRYATQEIVHLAAIALLFVSSAIAANPMTEPEKWAIAQLTATGVADFAALPDKSSVLTGAFVAALLCGQVPNFDIRTRAVRIKDATIDGVINTSGATASEIVFVHCNFKNSFALNGPTVEHDLIFLNCTFNDVFSIASTSIESHLNINNTTFVKPASFNSVVVRGNFSASGAKFESAAAYWLGTVDVDLTGLICANHGDFGGTSFAGAVSFEFTKFVDLDIASPSPIARLDLSHAVVERHLSVVNTNIADLSASLLQVGQYTLFSKSAVTHSASFRDSSLGMLHLIESNWPTGRNLDLHSMTYTDVKMSEDEQASDEKFLQFVNGAQYSPDIYAKLERFFTDHGNVQIAADAHIQGKCRERATLPIVRKTVSYLLDVLTAYGRQTWRVGWVCVFFVALGSFVFSTKRMESRKKSESPRVYNRFWYSLGLFLPFVDLQSDKLWKPRNDERLLRHYMRIHILLGWILVPIFIAAIAGLIT